MTQREAHCHHLDDLNCRFIAMHLPIHVGLLVMSQLPIVLDLSQPTLKALLHQLIAADLK